MGASNGISCSWNVIVVRDSARVRGSSGNFHVSRNLETSERRAVQPMRNRRRSSLAEIPPSFLTRDRDRSMIAKNLRFVLSDTVSSSALEIGTTAANGLPRLTTITGFFLACWAYFDKGPDAFFNSILVIAGLHPFRFEPGFSPSLPRLGSWL